MTYEDSRFLAERQSFESDIDELQRTNSNLMQALQDQSARAVESYTSTQRMLNQLSNENETLKQTIAGMNEKLSAKRHTTHAIETFLNPGASHPSHGYNIPELLRICRTVIARRGLFTLSTPELQVVYGAVCEAALQKDPIRHSQLEISYAIDEGRGRIDSLQNELSDTKHIMSRLKRSSKESNISMSSSMGGSLRHSYKADSLIRSKKADRLAMKHVK